MTGKRVLLVHLVSNGDCLMATTVARQIKADFPGCHLTWAISFKCKQVIENNPYVDATWSVEYGANELAHEGVWHRTKAEAERRRRDGDFDLVYYTQIFPENFNNFDGTTRTSLFRSYPSEITVPVQPVLRLREAEVERVSRFAAEHQLRKYAHVVLFECAPASQQSSLSIELAIRVANRIVAARQDTAFIISTHRPFPTQHPAVIDGSSLSYRENAELSKHCSLLLGCSSGITWLLTSDWAKKLPTIQFLNQNPPWFAFASVRYDHRHFGLDTSHILETTARDEGAITAIVARYLAQGSFTGIDGVELEPSLDQLYGLYEMMNGRIALRRVLDNFLQRNPGLTLNEATFFYQIARCRVRAEARALWRKLASTARQFLAASPRR